MNLKLPWQRTPPVDLLTSKLLDESIFYQSFMRDLNSCKEEVIIESPFIASWRVARLLPALQRLAHRGVRIIVNTRDPATHCLPFDEQARGAIAELQQLGADVFFTGNHHRKLAVIDNRILYEGSLNILSQSNSCEVMRRIESVELAREMRRFLRLRKLYF